MNPAHDPLPVALLAVVVAVLLLASIMVQLHRDGHPAEDDGWTSAALEQFSGDWPTVVGLDVPDLPVSPSVALIIAEAHARGEDWPTGREYPPGLDCDCDACRWVRHRLGTTAKAAETLTDDYHLRGVYCGEPAHCPPPHPGALPGGPYPPVPAGGLRDNTADLMAQRTAAGAYRLPDFTGPRLVAPDEQARRAHRGRHHRAAGR